MALAQRYTVRGAARGQVACVVRLQRQRLVSHDQVLYLHALLILPFLGPLGDSVKLVIRSSTVVSVWPLVLIILRLVHGARGLRLRETTGRRVLGARLAVPARPRRQTFLLIYNNTLMRRSFVDDGLSTVAILARRGHHKVCQVTIDQAVQI